MLKQINEQNKIFKIKIMKHKNFRDREMNGNTGHPERKYRPSYPVSIVLLPALIRLSMDSATVSCSSCLLLSPLLFIRFKGCGLSMSIPVSFWVRITFESCTINVPQVTFFNFFFKFEIFWDHTQDIPSYKVLSPRCLIETALPYYIEFSIRVNYRYYNGLESLPVLYLFLL